jgi:hypothetical protein
MKDADFSTYFIAQYCPHPKTHYHTIFVGAHFEKEVFMGKNL